MDEDTPVMHSTPSSAPIPSVVTEGNGPVRRFVHRIAARTSLRQRIFLVSLLPTLFAMVSLLIFFLPEKLQAERTRVLAEAFEEAKLLAHSSRISLSRQDDSVTTALMESLSVNPHVTRVELMTPAGVRIAAYRHPERDAPRAFQAEDVASAGFFEERVAFTVPVVAYGQEIAQLRVTLLMEDILEVTRTLSVKIALLVLGLVVFCLGLARLLGNAIAQPIRDWIQLAQDVDTKLDFSQRAVLTGNLELDQLNHAFNTLLSTIESRDIALQRYQTSLEQQVVERTRELEAAKLRAEANSLGKTRFIGTLSHELRTPLNGILGIAGLLRYDCPETLTPMVEEIEESGKGLLKCVNSLIEYAQLETRDVCPQQLDFSPRELVGHLVQAFRESALEKNIVLHWQVDELVPEFVLSDMEKTSRALEILLENALKFTSAGTLSLSVGLGPPDAVGSQQLLYRVRDTGPGISAEQQANIFNPFTQANQALNREHAGLGLGLAIFTQLVRHAKGRQWLESTPGEGSCFTFSVPYETSHFAEQVMNKSGQVEAAYHLPPRA